LSETGKSPSMGSLKGFPPHIMPFQVTCLALCSYLAVSRSSTASNIKIVFRYPGWVCVEDLLLESALNFEKGWVSSKVKWSC
jgi:hypothetical protein